MDWRPFVVCPDGQRPPAPRGPSTHEGLGDRLRTAAFAERQARDAFFWAAERFPGESAGRRALWKSLGEEEDKHMRWLLERMEQLGFKVDERPVSDGLWRSLARCKTPEEFAAFMARAEERGRAAERAFQKMLEERDPRTAAIFARIADDEDRHIALAGRGVSA
jgi:uncharacterized ferritin-like protein (DUF455 family)